MKRNLAVVLLSAVFVLGLLGVTDEAVAQKKPVVLRLVIPMPAGDWPFHYMTEEMAKRFNARTQGEYKMEVHAGGALAKLPEYFDAIRVGAVEMACAPWPMYSFLDARLGILEAPFLFNNNDAANQGIRESLPLYDKILQEKFNAKGLGFFNTGGLELWSTVKPVKTLDDWKGFLTAAISPTIAGMVKDLGGSPVTIMWPDMYEALQKKIVNGAVHSTHGGRNFSFPAVCKYSTISFMLAGSNGFSINLDVWKKMPPKIQKILIEEIETTLEWYRKGLPKMDADDFEVMKKKGVSVYFLAAEERTKWVKATSAFREKQFGSFGDFGVKIRQIVDEANKKYPYKPAK
jgi:TRAP-type C4-dicarboxylate transport system substrate-binding protein